MALKVGIAPTMPRLAGRQMHRNNVTATCPEEYYRRAVTVPFLDHILQEINTR